MLKMRGYTPTVSSPLAAGLRKRKRLEEKENSDGCASPILSGHAKNKPSEDDAQPTPKRRANILARSTPTRQTGLLTRRYDKSDISRASLDQIKINTVTTLFLSSSLSSFSSSTQQF